MNASKLRPKKVLFIKLGQGGMYEQECIERDQTLKIGYRAVNQELCMKGDWDSVYRYFLEGEKSKSFVAASHTNQLRQFYEEGEETLWITFYANRMWWCFSRPEIHLLEDNRKIRPVIGNWSDKDINGMALNADTISGKLLKTQGFRGTICSVQEEIYALAKINGEQLKEVNEVENAMPAI